MPAPETDSSPTSANTRAPFSKWLGVALALGLALRLGWMFAMAGVIENEGTEYARIAESLLRGEGWAGVKGADFSLWVPPLYPILIAAVAFFGPDAETAGRLISVAFGLGLIAVVYAMALRLYGERSARFAALLTACHPLLFILSATVYSEMLFLTVSTAGMLLTLRARDSGRINVAILAGLLFGAGYLARPQGLLMALLAGVWLIGVAGRQWRPALRQSAALWLAFGLMAAPYVAVLSANVGELRWELKTPMNLAIGKRIVDGMTYAEASLSVKEDGTATGVYHATNLEQMKLTTPSLAEYPRYVAEALRVNLFAIFEISLLSLAYGAPILTGLVMLGLFVTPWSLARARDELVVLFAPIGCLVALATMQYMSFRYAFGLLPALMLWSGRGLAELESWALETVRGWGFAISWSKRTALAVVLTAASFVFVFSIYKARHIENLAEGFRDRRASVEAGEWLRGHDPQPGKVLDTRATVPYYSGGLLVPYPWSSVAGALNFIDKQGVRYVVVRERDAHTRPYLRSWLDEGIPDDRATLVGNIDSQPGDQILIYAWDRP